MPKKRPEQQNPRTHASAKARYKNQDKHRWRKVGALSLPVAVTVPLAFVFIGHGAWLIWLLVVTIIMFLGFALILLEWYIWKANPARGRLRLAFFAFSAAAVFVGLFWQATASKPPSIAAVDSKPPQTPLTLTGGVPGQPSNRREFLDVDPDKLLDFFEKYNEAQADDLVKPYLGKWMDVSGVVVSVTNETIIPEGIKSVGDVIKGIRAGVVNTKAKKRSPPGMTQAQFDEQRWIDRAKVLRPFKDTVTVRGQIKYIFSYGFFLEHCEIIE